MTIQIGHLAIHYDGPQLSSPRARHLLESVTRHIDARRQRLARQSIVAVIVRRWLVVPAMVGMLIGMLIQ